jgi:penicillin amidase
MKAIQLDVISDDHKKICQQIVKALEASSDGFDELQVKVIESLRNWDGSYTLEQTEPTVFTKLLYHFMFNTMVDEIGKEDFDALQGSYIYKGSLPGLISNEQSIWWDDISTSQIKEGREEAAIKAFEKTIKELRIQFGDNMDTWKWKKVHLITHNHPLGAQKPLDKLFNVGPYPITGGNDVPNKMMYKSNGEGEYAVYSSPALRILLDFADIENSESINPTGQSGNVMSPHYKDQTIMFNEGIYRPQLMNRETIDAESKTLILKSKKK